MAATVAAAQPPTRSRRHRGTCAGVVLAGVLLSLSAPASGDEADHKYGNEDRLYVYGNKIGPFNNPLETYGYFDVLPWCEPANKEAKALSVGEALAGDELIKLDVELKFKKQVKRTTICSKKLSVADAKVFSDAVKQQYWYQLYIDDLPTWAALGKVNKQGVPYLYTHQRFSLGYNGDRIVVANLTAEGKVEIPKNGGDITFTYNVEWQPSKVTFENRFRRYLDESFFEHTIHWMSVLNSFMMVFVLACIVLIVLLRTLKADYARYDKEIEDDATELDESGWKQVHGDVFRVPPAHVLLCSLVGTGTQLAVLCFCLIFIAIASVVYTERSGLLTYGVAAYAVTSGIAGYSSARLFINYAAAGPAISKDWKTTMVYTAALFPGIVGTVIFLLNLLAVSYSSQQAIPFVTMVGIVLRWVFVSLPLVIAGTLIGRHQKRSEQPRVSQIPRRIPEKGRYNRPLFLLAGGILPFGSIFIELYFVFTSFWNYKFYYVYGFMLLVYVILITVTMCLSVVYTYYLLNSEDYRWQWASFSLGASTAGYVFIYASYFFMFKTKMDGLFMTCFYFGYMLLFCIGLAILCGTVSFLSADLFVRRIYSNIKSD